MPDTYRCNLCPRLFQILNRFHGSDPLSARYRAVTIFLRPTGSNSHSYPGANPTTTYTNISYLTTTTITRLGCRSQRLRQESAKSAAADPDSAQKGITVIGYYLLGPPLPMIQLGPACDRCDCHRGCHGDASDHVSRPRPVL